MTNPCEQEHHITALTVKVDEGTKNQAVLMKGQEALAVQHMVLVQKLDSFFDRLEAILLADMERRTQMDQALRDIDKLYKQQREIHENVDAIHTRNAICDGAGVMAKTDKMWIWMQQEQGWRRFLPVAISLIVGLLAIYVTITDINDRDEWEALKADHRAASSIPDPRQHESNTYGIPR
jgi:hypothetical protein